MTDSKKNIFKSDSNNSFVVIDNENKKSNETNSEPEFDISSVQAFSYSKVVDPIKEIGKILF